MIKKYEIGPGHREHVIQLNRDTEYCVSGSGTFTILVTFKHLEVYGVILREDYIQLPKFSEDCTMKLVGRDTMSFLIYVSDSNLS